jgi:hypothetical protein
MQQCIKFYYSIFIWSSACFGRHTAHHHEPKTALAASGFLNVETTVPDNVHQLHVQITVHVWKTRGCQCSFRLLLMGGVSRKTCWASYTYAIIKFYTHIVASCGVFIMNQVFRFLIIFLSTSKIFPIIQGHLKMFLNISYTWIPFVHSMNIITTVKKFDNNMM